MHLLLLVVVHLKALHLLCRKPVPVKHSSLFSTVPSLGLLTLIKAALDLFVPVPTGGHDVPLLLLVLEA